ncbi:MAG TPA: xanthine dehydrogenase family protein subunit M [Thermodesulfobacteriota bacterium]|nr:xanthine dehydrogenase family protein subunit M [Thermodesulfobacteriota bacterium]
MRLRKFEFSSPSSLAEALELMEKHGAGAKLIAGGTDLLVQMKSKTTTPPLVISLLKIPKLSEISPDGKGCKIGALAKHARIGDAPILQERWGILASAARKVGSPQIRNWGTVGGNLCNASPAADTAPPLLVLEAEVILVGRRGERRLPLESFFVGPGVTALTQDEILKEILIPEAPGPSAWAYLKLGRRKSLDLALSSVAVWLTADPHTKVCCRARMALGAVAPTPMRAKETEKFLEGKVLEERVILEAGAKAAMECNPISDIRASAEYRREMVNVLVQRAIKKSLGEAIPPTGI